MLEDRMFVGVREGGFGGKRLGELDLGLGTWDLRFWGKANRPRNNSMKMLG